MEKEITDLSYRKAGVDIDAGAELVEAIKPLAGATARPGVASEIGGFGALFDLRAAGYEDPLLVAASDGVGTKLLIATAIGNHGTIGIDLVAMCVNDLVVSGAEPLFFLDYLATGRLDTVTAKSVIAGIAEGCRNAGCALIGGETAEMPGLYTGGDYDLAGFAVGAVERDRVLSGTSVREGDKVIGIASSGLHSNGFSLVRRVIEERGLDYADPAPFDPARELGDALLEPTRIYVECCLAAIAAGGVGALAHITGGGLVENLPRVLPEGLGVRIDAAAWTIPEVFQWLVAAGSIAPREAFRTFNCGIGMVVVAAPEQASRISSIIEERGERTFDLGNVVGRAGDDPPVIIEGMEKAWRG